MENSIKFSMPIYDHQDLCVNSFGHSVTAPCHKCGPSVRSYYLIHYILDGKGEYTTGNTTYKLSAGQGFLIEPDCLTSYISDANEPWTYVWVGLSGKNAKELISSVGLSQEQPIFRSPETQQIKEYVMNMIHHNHSSIEDTYYTNGMLYLFLSTIAASNRDTLPAADGNQYVEQSISYIQNHITEPLKVEDIARYVGLNRTYLSMIFKKHTGLSPLKYIQAFRLTKAKYMLESSTLPIYSIAYSCGYQTPEALNKIFRQQYNISPAAYRAQIKKRTYTVQQHLHQEYHLS